MSSFCWPYLALHDEGNSFTLINCFDKDVMNEIDFTNDKEQVLVNFRITDSFDIYLLTRRREEYIVLHIDLDQFKQVKHHNAPIDIHEEFKYSAAEVDHDVLKSMWVRGEQKDTDNNFINNMALSCFF